MDENKPTVPTEVQQTAEEQLQVVDKGAYSLEENKFSGALEGLRYYVLQFKSGTDDEAKTSIEAIVSRWQPKQIVAIINSSVRAAQRVKAQQEILSLEKEKQPQEIVKRLQHNAVLFSPEDADKWVPGERELTLNGMMRKVAELQKEGKIKEAMELLAQVQQQMVSQLAEQQAEQQS